MTQWTGYLAGACALVAVALFGYWSARRAAGHRVGAGARWLAVVLAVVAVVAGGALLWSLLAGGGSQTTDDAAPDSADASTPKPVVPVQTVPIRTATLRQTITVYGTVVAQPGETRVVSLAFEARVGRVRVAPGQQVTAGTSLLEVEPSSTTRLQLEEARNALAASKQELDLVQQQYDQKLATNSQLLQARQAFQSARLKLDNLEKQGIGKTTELKAEVDGIVSKVSAQEGQIVPAFGPLVEIAVESRIQARLGVEPEDVSFIHAGDPVQLMQVDRQNGPAIIGHVRLVTRQVNPSTRLIDIFVSVPPDSRLTLDGYVEGILTTRAQSGLVVPRSAVLPEETGYTLYTVADGKAVKHSVTIALETDREVEVTGDHLKEGEPAVLVGNYELEDGMAVQVQAATTSTLPAEEQSPKSEAGNNSSPQTKPADRTFPKRRPASTQSLRTRPFIPAGASQRGAS